MSSTTPLPFSCPEMLMIVGMPLLIGQRRGCGRSPLSKYGPDEGVWRQAQGVHSDAEASW